MRTAICVINSRTYEAVTFGQDQHFEFIRNAMVCPECSGPAFYRGLTQNGREACFGARHAEGCMQDTSDHDEIQNTENGEQAANQRIVVDFSTDSTGTCIERLLHSLIDSEEFRRSTNRIEIQGHGEFAVSDLFVNFADVTDEHIDSYHGYWVSFFASIHPPGFHTHSPRHGVLNWFVNVS
jgi:hypothetical protein